MIRAGSFGFVGEVQFGLDDSVRTRMLDGYPVTPPEAAFLALVSGSHNFPVKALWRQWQDRHRLRSAVNVPALTN